MHVSDNTIANLIIVDRFRPWSSVKLLSQVQFSVPLRLMHETRYLCCYLLHRKSRNGASADRWAWVFMNFHSFFLGQRTGFKGLPVFLASSDDSEAANFYFKYFPSPHKVSWCIPLIVFASIVHVVAPCDDKYLCKSIGIITTWLSATDLPFFGPINIPTDAMKILQNLHQHRRL